MTTTPPDTPLGTPVGPAPEPGDAGPRATRDEIRDLGRLRRSTGDRKLAGVSGGLARHLDVDPVILRVAFVVLVFFGGAGLLLYGALWLLVPEEGSTSAPLGLDERSRTVALTLVGVLAVLAVLGDSWGFIGFPWPLVVPVLLAALVASLVLSSRRVPTAPAATHLGADPTAPAPRPAERPAPPADPRRRGPVLFWFTLALAALGIGVLGIVDLAGADVPPAAYPALVVALTGSMLVVGAFFGRAGGLIALGLVASIGLASAAVAAEIDSDRVREAPTSAAGVRGDYDIGVGELVLDLTGVSDVEALDGRLIHLEGGIGRIQVILPAGVDAEVSANVSGPGHAVLFDDEHGGVDTFASTRHDGGPGAPNLLIDAEIGIGEIDVSSASTPGRSPR